MLALATAASAQTRMSLGGIIMNGNRGDFYEINHELVGVYVPRHYPNVVFATDNWNNSVSKTEPTEEQKLYDHNEDFDQSNWIKILFPENYDANQYMGKIINNIYGRVNVASTPAGPVGLYIAVTADKLPTVGDSEAYQPNTYCTANFVQQNEWYFVRPKNLEYAMIHWAVWHAADKKFYVPKQAGTVNSAGLKGSFPVDMALWEPDPNVEDPNTVFLDGYLYEFVGLVEMGTDTQIGLNIDPGFDGDFNIFDAPRRMPVGEAGSLPEGYHTKVFPLHLIDDPVITGVEQVRTGAAVQSVRYVDVQGHVAAEPRPGVNICVTTYSDGTVLTEKVLF